MTLAYIALGSNIEPEHNLSRAVELLAHKVLLREVSPVYVTPPWGYAPQADFLNAVAAAETDLPPVELLDLLLEIELECGRERTVLNGPRTLDLDLLLYGDNVMETPRLILPHSRLHQRGFVLMPLHDLAPELTHPTIGHTISRILKELPPSEVKGIRPSEFRLEPVSN